MKLRDYQEQLSTQAAKLLHEHKIAYLSMAVRVGKTLTALEAARKYGAKYVIFITKKKAISSVEGDYISLKPGFRLAVMNYEQLPNFNHEGFDLIIADEAHCLGAFPITSERTKLLKNIAAGLPIIFLSGTPTPESYSQLYHQFWISSYSPFAEYKSFYKWAKDYVTVKAKYLYNRQINDYSQANKEKIDEVTGHLFLSYSQEDAGFKQQIEEHILRVKMNKGTYFLADKLVKNRVHIGKDGEELVADTEVKLQQKLHQIYSGTVILEDGRAVIFDRSKAISIKENFAGQKIAIFYKFKAEEHMLYFVFGATNITTDPQAFNESADKVFISQVQSGREGINLSTADAIVMLNIDFSAVSYFQSRDRLQVKDRVKPAKVYWVFSEGGIEDRIYKAVSNKKDYTLSYFIKDFGINRIKKIA